MNLSTLFTNQQLTISTSILILAIGWVAGALVNYLSDVLPIKHRLVMPFCFNCETPQPLSSYLFWFKRCPSCTKLRPWRTWIVIIVYMLITFWLWLIPQHIPYFILNYLLFIYFGIVVVIDLRTSLNPAFDQLAGGFLGLLTGILIHGVVPTIAGGGAGFLIMFILYLLGGLFSKGLSRWRHVQNNEEALGFGDVNLSAVLGLLLGWPGIILGLFVAVMIGGVISVLYLVYLLITRRYHMFAAFPYGPCIIASAILLLYFQTIW